MRILHVINGLGSGGAEKLVVEICSELSKDFNTGLYLLENKNNFFSDQLSEKVVLYNKSSFKYSFKNLIQLHKTIKKYDIIHAHLFPTLYFVAFLSLFFPNKKFVFTEHNTTNQRRKIKLLKPIEKLIYSRFNIITSISKAVQKHLIEWIGDDKRIVLLYNFIDTERISESIPIPIADLGYSEEDKIIVMVGSFSNDQKRQQDLINAMTYLPPTFKAIFIGEGNRMDEYKKMVSVKNLENRVKFLGKKKDVYSIMKSCNYGVLSSEWEGFGLVALEYMACDIPSLGSNVEGLNEVVKNENVVFEKNNPKELAKKIVSLHNHPMIYKEVLHEQKKILETFDKHFYFKELKRIYLNLTQN